MRTGLPPTRDAGRGQEKKERRQETQPGRHGTTQTSTLLLTPRQLRAEQRLRHRHNVASRKLP